MILTLLRGNYMKLIVAFLKLVRWKNLVFIILTQLLFIFCIYEPVMGTAANYRAGWLILGSVFIAAAGYIINDYFDLNIDQVNKPNDNVFIRVLHRRWAIIWHFLLSLCGIVATAMATGMHKWYLVLANIGCVALLWLYSTSLKRTVLFGNIAIALLTAWTVLILFFYFTEPSQALGGSTSAAKLFRVSFLYAGFAFIISLIREAIKDMEDLEGDARYHCRTLPIVAGLRATKIYVVIWCVVLAGSLITLELYILLFTWWLTALYSFVFVVLPLALLMKRLIAAVNKDEFSKLSALSKFIMFTGIISMAFFRYYS